MMKTKKCGVCHKEKEYNDKGPQGTTVDHPEGWAVATVHDTPSTSALLCVPCKKQVQAAMQPRERVVIDYTTDKQ